jgi:PAS domain S-box-containing protein
LPASPIRAVPSGRGHIADDEMSSRWLAAIVESSDDAIIGKDLTGVITSWNAGAQQVFGYSAAEIIGRSVTTLIPADRLGEEATILARICQGQRVEHFETVRRHKDGSLLHVSLTISPIRDRDGNLVGASKIARDITQQKRTEQQLAAARDALSHANEELERQVSERTASLREAVAQLEEFSYTVSHDLRAPLRGMQVYSQALLEDHADGLDAEARHCLQRIAENSSRLDRMITDVLAFSRVSRSELQSHRVSLGKIVREIVLTNPAMRAPRAQVQIEPLLDVLGHEPLIEQAIANLLSNAVKFVAAGQVPQVRIWSESFEGSVRLWLEDNGIGIPVGVQHRLFRMFERLHPSLPYEGTGIGLAIVRKAVTRMNGEVGLEPNEPTGCRFWIRLPAA